MKALAAIMIGMLFLCAAPGCKKKPDMNSVDLDQINVDDSNNYRYIFRDSIHDQDAREKKIQKKEF